MTDIDLTTGLPQLPSEDMFWRVYKNSYDYSIFSPPSIRVAIMKRVWKQEYRPRWFFRKLKMKEPHLYEIEVYSLGIMDDKGEYLSIEKVNEQLILETALVCLENYLNDQKVKSLLGDYPPLILQTEKEAND